MNPPPQNLSATHTSPYSSHPQNDYPSTAAATAAAALSQQQIPTAYANIANGRKRKASGLPGSRGVANLTAEQLAKKRANDREAQRAIRERTKTTIETLEKRIQELESQQPFQELQRVAQERDRALAECEQLRSKLAMVQSVIGGTQPLQQSQPNLHGMSDAIQQFVDPTWLTESETELAALTAQQSPLPPLNTQPTSQYTQSVSGEPYEQQHLHPELRSPHSDTRSTPVSHTATTGSTYHTDNASLRRWSPSLEQAPNSQYGGPNGMSYEPRLPPPAAMLEHSNSNGERLELNYVLEPKQHSASTSPTQGPATYPFSSASEKAIYARLPNNSYSACPLDSLLVDFLNDCQKRVSNGVPMRDVIGPDYPSFIALRDPTPTPGNAIHPVSALFTDILSKFPGISGLPERVATQYIMFLIMRWMICPCEACYERLPEWVRPLKEQLDVPHPAWNDYVPWPIIRLRLITTADVTFENFFIPFTSRLCLNWPYPCDQVLISAAESDDPSDVKINPVFESHLRDLRNWSLATVFKTTVPELIDQSVRIQD